MNNKTSFIEYPCNFPIKIIGSNTDLFLHEILYIVKNHFPDITDEAITARESENSNYLSITVTVYVENQERLDALYIELSSHPDVKMVL